MTMQPEMVVSLGQWDETPAAGTPWLRLDDGPADIAAARARAWLREHMRWPFQRLCVALDPEHPAHDDVLEAVKAHYIQAHIGQATIKQKAQQWGRNFLENLQCGAPPASSLDRPLHKRPAVVVGAGPSIDINGDLLAKFQARGAAIIASNTSAGACIERGCMPDVVVCCESKDVSSGLMATDGQTAHVMDVIASPTNWDVPARTRFAMFGHDPNLIPYALELGAMPYNYSSSVSCAAAALAIAWGATYVVLVGQDMAYTTDGRVYAKGSPFDDIRCEVQDGAFVFEGASKQMDPIVAVEAPAWGGGTIHTTHDMLNFRTWFEKAATSHAFINATEGGVHIHGAMHMPLTTVMAAAQPLAPLEPIEAQPHHADTDALLERIKARAQDIADNVDDYPAAPRDFPLLNMWTVPAILQLNKTAQTPKDRIDGIRQAILDGCRDIVEVCG